MNFAFAWTTWYRASLLFGIAFRIIFDSNEIWYRTARWVWTTIWIGARCGKHKCWTIFSNRRCLIRRAWFGSIGINLKLEKTKSKIVDTERNYKKELASAVDNASIESLGLASRLHPKLLLDLTLLDLDLPFNEPRWVCIISFTLRHGVLFLLCYIRMTILDVYHHQLRFI